MITDTITSMQDETCDRCGPSVRAVVKVHLEVGYLTMCAHHYRTHKTALDTAPFIETLETGAWV